MDLQTIQNAIDALPRHRFTHLPTPLQHCPRLSADLGGPRIWIKRDDLTGLAFGGNKSRYLEFTLAEATATGHDAAVLSAVVQSNHCRQFAAACARNITVSEVTFCNSISVSEHVVMMILGLVRNYIPR